MIQPVLSDDALLADIRAARTQSDTFHLWWLGQSGFLVQWKGQHLLFDPYLSDSLTKKYANTQKPHIRMTALPIAPERLNFINIVTSTHNHTDHLDAETLQPLIAANPGIKLVIPEANRRFVADRLQCDPAWPRGLDDGTTLHWGLFNMTGIAAAHETFEQDEQGRHKYLGYLVRFGPYTLYHSGDTVLYPDMAEHIRRLSKGKIDVALLPINGSLPERRVAGNLWGGEAAALAKNINARMVIPMHYEMFTFNTEPPDEFAVTAQHIGQPYCVLKCGERWSGELKIEN